MAKPRVTPLTLKGLLVRLLAVEAMQQAENSIVMGIGKQVRLLEAHITAEEIAEHLSAEVGRLRQAVFGADGPVERLKAVEEGHASLLVAVQGWRADEAPMRIAALADQLALLRKQQDSDMEWFKAHLVALDARLADTQKVRDEVAHNAIALLQKQQTSDFQTMRDRLEAVQRDAWAMIGKVDGQLQRFLCLGFWGRLRWLVTGRV